MKIFGIKKKTKEKKVLIVEDDALLSSVLMKAVTLAGYNAIIVKDGTGAIKMVRRFKPDIILLDLILPGLDGFAILKQLKSDDRFKNIPVFVLSNLDSTPDVKSAKALAADDYFIKANTEIKKIMKAIKNKIGE